MVIAFSHYSAKNDISGVTTWLEGLLLRIHGDGIRCVVLLHHFGPDVQDSSLLHSLSDAGIHVEIETRPPFTEDGVRSTLEFLNRHRPDVFFPHCLEAMFYAAVAAGREGLPWGLTIHSDDPVYWASAELTGPEANQGVLIGVSDYISRKAIELQLATHPETIPYGVRPLPKSAGFCESPFRVAFCGRVTESQKRFSLVLESMMQACQLDPCIECVVLGDGPALQSSRQRVEASDLAGRIQFRGRLTTAEVGNQLAQCQAVLLMSDFEGLPVALLEAMSIGVVPIVRKIPSGIPDLVRDGESGLLVNDNPESAAQAIVRLAHKPQLWTRCSSAARDLVRQDFDQQTCYQRWLELIEQLRERSTIQYPIAVPRRPRLPPVHPALVERDQRRPTPNDLFKSRVKRVMGRLKRLAMGRSSGDTR